MALCIKEDRVLITLDTDFLNVPHSPGLKIPGILLLRSKTQGKAAVKVLFEQFLKKYQVETIRVKIVVVEPHQVRIRMQKNLLFSGSGELLPLTTGLIVCASLVYPSELDYRFHFSFIMPLSSSSPLNRTVAARSSSSS